jgi:hypothetical protein
MRSACYLLFVAFLLGLFLELEDRRDTFFRHIVAFHRIRKRVCGLVVRVLGYRSRGPGSIPGTTRKKVVGLERGALSLVSTTEELLDRKVAAPV